MLTKSRIIMIVDTYLSEKLFGELLVFIYIIDSQLYKGCHFIFRSNNQLFLKMMIIFMNCCKIMNLSRPCF